jgi:transcriptional regulator with XRE-family HTH domain
MATMDGPAIPTKHPDPIPTKQTTARAWGVFLKQVRQSRGVSQRTLARRLGVSQARIAQIETGTSTPQIDTMSSYISALGGELILRAHFNDHAPEREQPTSKAAGM